MTVTTINYPRQRVLPTRPCTMEVLSDEFLPTLPPLAKSFTRTPNSPILRSGWAIYQPEGPKEEGEI